MEQIGWTEIILGLFTLISSFGWIIDRKKHRQEVESLRADVKQKELDLSKDYVAEWRTYIAEPLQREVNELRNEVAELRHAIELVSDCPHRDGCPVRAELQRSAAGE